MFDIARFVAESRAKQGLPPKVTDPAALERIARILVPPVVPRPAISARQRRSWLLDED